MITLIHFNDTSCFNAPKNLLPSSESFLSPLGLTEGPAAQQRLAADPQPGHRHLRAAGELHRGRRLGRRWRHRAGALLGGGHRAGGGPWKMGTTCGRVLWWKDLIDIHVDKCRYFESLQNLCGFCVLSSGESTGSSKWTQSSQPFPTPELPRLEGERP